MNINKDDYLVLIRMSLAEDLGSGDVTSCAVIPDDLVSSARLVAKDDGILCGVSVFMDTMLEFDSGIIFESYIPDGSVIKNGDVVISLTGLTRSIIGAERTALNFIQRMSGIATKTNRYVLKIKNYKTKILDTRKTLPGYRVLDKYSVKIGGGENHRFGLYDMFLIKENHIKSVDSISTAVLKARNFIENFFVEVEVTNIDEVQEACYCRVDRIMLDNMDDCTVGKSIKIIKDYNIKNLTDIETEVSGNVTEDRLVKLAEFGVDFISVGGLTHTVPAFDMSLLIE